MNPLDARETWRAYQPGLSGVTAASTSDDVARRRYELEPHILEVVPFADMRGVVVELGCGIGTDGLQIVKTARQYVGVDYSDLGLDVAMRRHAGHPRASFTRADLRRLPVRDGAIDFVYSHGVLHHIQEQEVVFSEMSRILAPGGRYCIMVYNRQSLNFQYGIRALRRAMLVLAAIFPVLARRLAAGRGESDATLDAHLKELKVWRGRYLMGPDWLSRNTDGPQNRYSRVYSRQQLRQALEDAGLTVDRFDVRYLNERVNPPWGLLPARLKRRLALRWGWHLYAHGQKPVSDGRDVRTR